MASNLVILTSIMGTVCLLWLTTEINSFVVKEEFWQHQFNYDFAIGGFIFTASASTASACGNLCTGFPRCQSFGFNSGSHTCWLYDHLVPYTWGYSVAPGTRYFWSLSARCPTELNYTLEEGLCFKIHRENLARPTAQAVCAGEGGTMFIGDTKAKLDVLKNHVTTSTWVGGSDTKWNGDWRWTNGRKMDVNSPIWLPGKPDNSSWFHLACVGTSGRLYHVSSLWANYPAACQVPML